LFHQSFGAIKRFQISSGDALTNAIWTLLNPVSELVLTSAKAGAVNARQPAAHVMAFLIVQLCRA
jgi:hypothetical protein